jgi:2,3-bisphosphoglycerate-independent phosphoglycerate mutase
LNCRLTETERYPHLTYFFNGGVENEHPCEQRVLVPSPKIAAYETQPEMSSFKGHRQILRGLEARKTTFLSSICPAADLIAQTGNLEKTIEAAHSSILVSGGILEKVRALKGTAMITSSHAGCEEMADLQTGEPNALPTTNPVPFHFVDDAANGMRLRPNGALEDVAPTILGILGIEKPSR